MTRNKHVTARINDLLVGGGPIVLRGALVDGSDITLDAAVRAADTLGLELHVRLTEKEDPLNAPRRACGLPTGPNL